MPPATASHWDNVNMATTADIFRTMDYGPAPEAAEKADAWLDEHGRKFDLFIDGAWRPAAAGQTFETFNPATDKVLASLAQAGDADVSAAVSAARAAQPGWEKLGGHGRARLLYALARLIQRHARLLAVLETLDNGKPIRETRDLDIPLVARHFYHHAGWAQVLDQEFPGRRALGVAGQIIPWNFPLLMLAWKVAPALAAGNTVVLKPAEFTSLTALLFAELCAEAGLPPGVVNIVTGDGATGELIVRHPDIDKIAFTGSTEVGRAIREQTAGTGKRLSLELGGKSPFIVFDDADIDGAVEGVVDAIWFNQGQVCCAGSRLLVQESIADTVLEKLRARMGTLRVGQPLDKVIDIGAIVAPVQLERIRALVATGQAEGSELYQPGCEMPAEGSFYPPSLFTNVSPSSTIAQEEIFGPVLVAMTFRTPGEAVALANNSRFGLAASVWTSSVGQAFEIAGQLQCGTVWVNSTNQFDAACGFGGYRESGFGREGGREGLGEYLRPTWKSDARREDAPQMTRSRVADESASNSAVDRTAKNYIGGAQKRPDSGYSLPVNGADGTLLGEVGDGNRKDIRDAVEAARNAPSWGTATAHNRAQVLYYVAENLDARANEFAGRLAALTGETRRRARREVTSGVERLFHFAAMADKFDGAVHSAPYRGRIFAMHEPVGVIGIVCPEEAPLLALLSVAGAALAMGNRIVLVPSSRGPLVATDFYQVLDTSDVPAGVVNIVTGESDVLARVLAEHDDVDALWYFGSQAGSAAVERASIGNLKRTWVDYGLKRDWTDATQGAGEEFLHQACQVKNVWVPFGA